ncbi:MAG TPA: hypothetical protein VFR14_04610 [Candidatus Limnocylindrales bacterium]|nr:hypothetical protein [Candidatus Limnocylindrales bacterium]
MTTYGTPLPRPGARFSRLPAGLMLFVILELTVVTALLHLSLGGLLFTLNGLGYLGLAAASLASATLPMPVVRRLSWLPRVGLGGYALITIGAYLLTGPYFALGWIAKGIELAIVGLVAADLLMD